MTAVMHERGFRHEALFYSGSRDFVAQTSEFIEEGIAGGQAVLVVVSREKIAMLQKELGRDSSRVHFADMTQVGRNPAWIIPEWQTFLDRAAAAGRGCRGVGEPITPSRTELELTECERHEELLNVAFEGTDWRLACPYDLTALDAAVLERAERTHPLATKEGATARTSAYPGAGAFATIMDTPLPPPPANATLRPFTSQDAATIRTEISRRAATWGLDARRSEELVISVHELAANSIRHGGGGGELLVWDTGDAVFCEVRDGGVIADPLAGRVRPDVTGENGYGLWLVNQLCDLVQIRRTPHGSAVRIAVYKR